MSLLKKMFFDVLFVFGYFGFSYLCLVLIEEGRTGLAIFAGVLAAVFMVGLIYRILPPDDGGGNILN